MAQAARKLQAVPNDPPEVRGDPTLTEEALAAWTPGQRKCRARRRHSWAPFTVWEHRNFYDVVERCSSCSVRRSADFNKQGRKLTKWQPDYRDQGGKSYLLPKGAAPLADSQRDDLTLSDLLSRRIVEAADDEDEEG